MKQSFWSKKCKEITVGETIKLTVYLCVALYAVMGMVWGIFLFWGNICNFFRGLMDKIKGVFTKKEVYED